MFKTIFSRRMLAVLLLGFSSGLPLLLIGSTFKAWMKDEGIDLTVIGLFAIVGLPYTLKFLWAPLLDRFVPPFLDRRRGWIFIFQIALAASFVVLANCSPAQNILFVGFITFVIAFFSASQDIVIDAYRREVLADAELGFGSSLAVNGYRIGMLMAGAGALVIADKSNWYSKNWSKKLVIFFLHYRKFLANKYKNTAFLMKNPALIKEDLLATEMSLGATGKVTDLRQYDLATQFWIISTWLAENPQNAYEMFDYVPSGNDTRFEAVLDLIDERFKKSRR